MIFLSAGHHVGAQGARWNGFTEWMEARQWVHTIHQMIPTGRSIVVPSGLLRQKVDFINSKAKDDDIAIEVHFNSAVVNGRHVGTGCETLYYPGSVKGRKVSEAIQNALVPVFPPDRGVKEGWFRMDRPGTVDYDGDVDGDEKIDYFLEKTVCPAVILEPEFIHHTPLLMDNRQAGCVAIAGALSMAERL
jgi:hypothetical protein